MEALAQISGAVTMAETLIRSINDLALLRRIQLRPGWSNGLEDTAGSGPELAIELTARLGWPEPRILPDAPRAHEYPVLILHDEIGWAVAERREASGHIVVLRNDDRERWPLNAECKFLDIVLPEAPSQKPFVRAIDVFVDGIARRKRVLALAILATVMVNLIALATSIYSMQVYDRVIPRGSFSTLWALSIGAVVALGFDFVLRVVRARLLEQEAAKIDSEVSEFFFARANDVRLDARPPSIGTMAAQLRGMEQIRSTMSSATIFALTDLPFALFFILVVAQLGGIIALVMVVSFPVSLLLALLLGRLIREDTKKVQVSGNRKNGLLVEALDAAETVKANRGGWFLLARWNGLIADLHRHELPVKDLQSISGSIFSTIQQLAYIATISWGAVQVFDNKMTMGALIACSILAGRINGPLIGQLPGMVINWAYTRISLEMLDGIMKLPTDRSLAAEVLRPSRLAGIVSMHGVTFIHAGARVGLEVPRLDIRAGERIGVIGGIGSGKSTLLRLMSALYAPGEGRVLIDGLDAATIAEDVIRRHVGYLPQDYRLINGTLRDNLLLGIDDPGDDALMEVAVRTGLDALITAHPQGIDLPIGEGGRGLSGGQRALAGLTRLQLCRPNLLLLDEPTSSLDVQTEARALSAIQEQLRPDDTMVLVTHKMQLLALVQRVLVMANGRIVMDGPTKDVAARLTQSASAPAASGPTGAAAAAAATV
jgi:ATP-binding cassette subfamily C protein LapB